LLSKTQAVALAILATLAVGGVVFAITASLPAALIAGAITAVTLAILIYCKYKPSTLPKPILPLPPHAEQPTIQQQIVQLINKAKSGCSAEDVTEWERLIKELGDKLSVPITEDQETVFHYLAKTGGPVEFVPLLGRKSYLAFHSTTLADGYTPLHLAIVNGHYEMTMAILKVTAGVSINIRAKNGMTALHLVVGKGLFKEETFFVVQELFNQSTIHNIQDGNGNTPLHLAAVRHDAAVVKVLKEGLGNLIRNNQGQTDCDLVKLKFEDARAFLEKAVGPDYFWDLTTEEAYDGQYERTARYLACN
jgi:hypothetical protein